MRRIIAIQLGMAILVTGISGEYIEYSYIFKKLQT